MRAFKAIPARRFLVASLDRPTSVTRTAAIVSHHSLLLWVHSKSPRDKTVTTKSLVDALARTMAALPNRVHHNAGAGLGISAWVMVLHWQLQKPAHLRQRRRINPPGPPGQAHAAFKRQARRLQARRAAAGIQDAAVKSRRCARPGTPRPPTSDTAVARPPRREARR